MNAISINELTHAFGRNPIMRSLTTNLPKQELNAVIGPNGSGKTTLLKILAGIYPLQSGTITGLDHKNKQRLMWIPAHIEMPFAYRVDEVLRMLLKPWITESTASNKITQALSAADLPEFGSRIFNSLSSGEQHRIALGAAIASGADTLILDEPCANLDIGAAHRFMKKLRLEAQRGRTLIISIHDLSLAYAHCGHILLLDPHEKPSTYLSGTANEVFASDAIKSAFHIRVSFVETDGKRHPIFSSLSD